MLAAHPSGNGYYVELVWRSSFGLLFHRCPVPGQAVRQQVSPADACHVEARCLQGKFLNEQKKWLRAGTGADAEVDVASI